MTTTTGVGIDEGNLDSDHRRGRFRNLDRDSKLTNKAMTIVWESA